MKFHLVSIVGPYLGADKRTFARESRESVNGPPRTGGPLKPDAEFGSSSSSSG